MPKLGLDWRTNNAVGVAAAVLIGIASIVAAQHEIFGQYADKATVEQALSEQRSEYEAQIADLKAATSKQWQKEGDFEASQVAVHAEIRKDFEASDSKQSEDTNALKNQTEVIYGQEQELTGEVKILEQWLFGAEVKAGRK
jgi:hypothetical protein